MFCCVFDGAFSVDTQLAPVRKCNFLLNAERPCSKFQHSTGRDMPENMCGDLFVKFSQPNCDGEILFNQPVLGNRIEHVDPSWHHSALTLAWFDSSQLV